MNTPLTKPVTSYCHDVFAILKIPNELNVPVSLASLYMTFYEVSSSFKSKFMCLQMNFGSIQFVNGNCPCFYCVSFGLRFLITPYITQLSSNVKY